MKEAEASNMKKERKTLASKRIRQLLFVTFMKFKFHECTKSSAKLILFNVWKGFFSHFLSLLCKYEKSGCFFEHLTQYGRIIN